MAPQNRLSDGAGHAWGTSEAVTVSSEPCEGQDYRSMTPWCQMSDDRQQGIPKQLP